MPYLEAFRAVASASPEAPLTLVQTSGRAGGVTHSDPSTPPDAPQHRAVTGRFIEALNGRYGHEIGAEVVRITGLDRTLSQGRPLLGRTVVQALDEAAYLVARNRWTTSVSAEILAGLSAPETPLESLRSAADERAFQLYPDETSLLHYVNFFVLSEKVRSAIIAAGEDGTHDVSNPELAAIRRQILDEELARAHAVTQRNALSELDVQRRDSILHKAVAAKFARFDPPIVLHQTPLTGDAAMGLSEPLRLKVRKGEITWGMQDANLLLMDAADREVARFMAGRQAARAAVAILRRTDTEARPILAEQVTRDLTPASLVPQLETAFLRVRARLANLDKPMPPRELEQTVSLIQHEITQAVARAQISPDELPEDAGYRCAWRFLLAPGGAAQAEAILGALARNDSLLRGIAEAAGHVAGARGSSATSGTENRKVRTPALTGLAAGKSSDPAGKLWKMLQSLQAVLRELAPNGSPGADLTPNHSAGAAATAALGRLVTNHPSPSS